MVKREENKESEREREREREERERRERERESVRAAFRAIPPNFQSILEVND